MLVARRGPALQRRRRCGWGGGVAWWAACHVRIFLPNGAPSSERAGPAMYVLYASSGVTDEAHPQRGAPIEGRK